MQAGTITADQKQKIVEKQAELKAQRESERSQMSTMSEADRKAAMEKHRTELESWAQTNGIDIKYLMFGHGRGFGPGHGPKPDDTTETKTQ